MSKIREFKVDSASQETLVAGAIALGFKAIRHRNGKDVCVYLSEEDTRKQFVVTADGSIVGDFYYIWSLAGVQMPVVVEERPKAVVELVFRAGAIRRIEQFLSPQGWSVETNYKDGSLKAIRGNEQVTVSVDKDCRITAEGFNFIGNSCSLVIDMFMEQLGTGHILNETSKVEEAKVVRTVV